LAAGAYTYFQFHSGFVFLSLSEKPAMTAPSPSSWNPSSPESILEDIFQLYRDHGDAAYLGEPVTQTQHALQSAWAAEQAGADSALIAAALLHDIGHILPPMTEGSDEKRNDDLHEERGARWLRQFFPRAVTEPIRLHVPAKRYLCATDPDYFARLSPVSVQTLKLQGGPYSAAEAEDFEFVPFAAAAVTLRRFDDAGKEPNLTTPDWNHFRPYLEANLVQPPS
jgi:phosphonate degradation associated HDIG domain protein